MSQASFPSNENQEWDINIELSQLGGGLLQDQNFIQQVAELVRIELLKDSRRMGNVFGKWAQRTIVPSSNTNRLT